ncbi:MAG: two-component regulator propeller domain-containing protein [Bacteroidota bacterium]
MKTKVKNIVCHAFISVQFLTLLSLFFTGIQSIATAQNPFWENHLYTGNIAAMAKEGNSFWLACQEGGLIKFNPNTSVSSYFNKNNSAIPSVFLSAIAIDSNGMKWIGTTDSVTGLIRFDGINSWTCFNTTNSALPSNVILSILVHGSDLWVGTAEGLAKYNGVSWTNYTSAIYNSILYPIKNVMDLAIDSNDNIWLCCRQVGVFTYNNSNWKVFTAQNSGINCDTNNYVYSLIHDDSGKLWVSHMRGVSCLNGSSWTSWNPVNIGPPYIGFTDLESIKVDNAGDIWVCDRYHGLYKYNGINWLYKYAFSPPLYYISTANFPNMGLFNKIGFIDNTNKIWTVGPLGLSAYDSVWTDYFDTTNTGMTNPGISCLNYTSSTNTFVLGTVGNGNINSFFYSFGSGLTIFAGNNWSQYNFLDNCWPFNYIFALNTLGSDIWMGTKSGVSHFDGTNFTYHNWNPTCSPDERTRAFGRDNHFLYAGTKNGRVFKFDGSTWTLTNIPLSGYAINSILSYGSSLLVGSGKGLLKYDTLTSFIYSTSNSGLPNNMINDILFDSTQNCLWLATDNGLVKTDLVNWVVYNTTNSGIPGNHITSLIKDHLNNLWLGTSYYGLARFDGSGFTTYNTVNSGLTDNRITDIEVDNDDNIWIATEKGGLCSFKFGVWLSDNNLISLSGRNDGSPELEIFPNPILNAASLKIILKEAGPVSITIYNSVGKKINTIFDEISLAGQFTIYWNLQGNNGINLAPGLYFCTLSSNQKTITKRFIVLK